VPPFDSSLATVIEERSQPLVENLRDTIADLHGVENAQVLAVIAVEKDNDDPTVYGGVIAAIGFHVPTGEWDSLTEEQQGQVMDRMGAAREAQLLILGLETIGFPVLSLPVGEDEDEDEDDGDDE
jgi:hypothetical protein